jgi:uncharacterized membrane protein YeaQ/YmgE (transglycosylase-associated protein family)
MGILVIIIIGGVAGWLAGSIVQSENSSLILDIIVGIVGGWLGYKLFGHMLNITSSRFVNEIITATAGAVVLAAGIKIIRKILN